MALEHDGRRHPPGERRRRCGATKDGFSYLIGCRGKEQKCFVQSSGKAQSRESSAEGRSRAEPQSQAPGRDTGGFECQEVVPRAGLVLGWCRVGAGLVMLVWCWGWAAGCWFPDAAGPTLALVYSGVP